MSTATAMDVEKEDLQNSANEEDLNLISSECENKTQIDASEGTDDKNNIQSHVVEAAATLWRFLITDKYLTPYKFEVVQSATMSVWDIKVRLQQSERVEIEPRLQQLIYKGRFLNNDELISNIIVDMDANINMHLMEQSPICNIHEGIFHDEMVSYLTGMGVNKDMAAVALDVTDDMVDDALEFLRFI